MKIIAIIPARGGSKGVPGKNIRPVYGRPLIAHTIMQARQCQQIDRVIVSTDSDEITQVAEKYGAEVIRRPFELSGDTAPSESALLHVLGILKENENYKPDIVVFLQATSPIRRLSDIQDAISHFSESGADSLLSVTRFDRFVWRRNNRLYEPLNYDYHKRPRRQDKSPEFLETGSIYIFKPWVLHTYGSRLGGRVEIFEMDYWSSIEIDNEEDILLCEYILRTFHQYSPGFELPQKIDLIIFDFDGVFTDNTVITDENGKESVVCSREDGYGIELLKKYKIPMIVLSRESNMVVEARCKKLGIESYTSEENKKEVLLNIFNQRGINPGNVMYVGNDIPDLECMDLAGCAVAPSDAHPQVLAHADMILGRPGGKGSIRELCDLIISTVHEREKNV